MDTNIMIELRRPPLLLFEEAAIDHIEPHPLHSQPDEGSEVQMKAKRPHPTGRPETVKDGRCWWNPE